MLPYVLSKDQAVDYETRKQLNAAFWALVAIAMLLWLLIGENYAKDFYPLRMEAVRDWRWWTFGEHEGPPRILVLLLLICLIGSLTALGSKPVLAIFGPSL